MTGTIPKAVVLELIRDWQRHVAAESEVNIQHLCDDVSDWTPPPPATPTKRVRIALIAQTDGSWWVPDATAETEQVAIDPENYELRGNERLCVIAADIPIPQPVEVQGTVESR